jgi:hypothetical protein
LRRVVIGYFVEDLPMHVLAEGLGVTDSRNHLAPRASVAV